MALRAAIAQLGRRRSQQVLWPACSSASAHSEAAPATLNPDVVSEAFSRAITPEVAEHLAAKGYAVVDGIFGPALAASLREEVVRLYEQGRMTKNHTHLVRDNATSLLEKAHVHEAELSLDSGIQAAAPLCTSLNQDLTLGTLLSLMLPQLTLDTQMIKLQYNSGGGGCFPIHFDSDEQLDGRRVTAIFYLNPGWRPEHGGQLRLYPFPAPPLDLEPLNDRLVLFASTRMPHRVLPATGPPRCCFTIWLSQTRRRAFVRRSPAPSDLEPPSDPDQDPAAATRFLMHPAVRQHVCKLVYDREWEQSLVESHAPSPARDSVLEQHRRELDIIRRSLARFLPTVERLQRGQLRAAPEWF
ncbi:hypothetical protein HYH03_001669 [Edaphochlamys debaryana]|uniref:Prolyl 4-hydroxylase alpha subunit domain-containing protein n=1 Tax=Edaphochlamys debaryana TaxID=47281 RepID=A0A835YDJ4_9CHLO|nr:hypothetical protein HYH03_001669 [Edaphochlamys debaryana]|eukprot:KAG2500910.1 hypothetical protein HYH03_001669 [Edaphochlamys debaryana]